MKDFLNTLAIRSGIGQSESIEGNITDLKNWGVAVEDKDLDDRLDYACLSGIVSSLLDEGDDFDSLKQKNIIDPKSREKQRVYVDEGDQVIDKTVSYMNDRQFDHFYDFQYLSEPKTLYDEIGAGDLIYTEEGFKKAVEDDGEEIVLEDASFEDVYAYLEIADTYYIDFEEAEIIPYGEQRNTSYINENFNLLASNNHVFNSEGFRISYTLNKSGIDVHVSRDVDGVNIYGDLSLNDVKPSFKWKYEEDDVKNCYFNLSFRTTEKIGASIGRYGNYHLKLKDLDSSSFRSLLGSIIEKQKDEVEATIPICQIRTPIPDIPTAYLNIDLLIKLYVSGKVEAVLYNSHSLGFETKDGQIRFINDSNRDLDAIIQASSKAAMGINLNLEAARFRLADVELDGGIRALVKSTIHLYDEEGEVTSESTDYSFSTLQELSDENPDVKVCGDISLYYLLDLIVNTSKTRMAKYGFSKTYHIMDEDNQVFHNLSHIEDGHFVKSCTRKKRTSLLQMNEFRSNRIVLNSYAEVIRQNETFQIEITALPEGYSKSDIAYSSLDNKIAIVYDGLVQPINPGSTRINVHTKDNKYNAYVNILVSTQ